MHVDMFDGSGRRAVSTRVSELREKLHCLADEKKARNLQRFFKTGPGEYGEGDRFLGINVPVLRRITRSYRDLTVDEAIQLLRSPIHEERYTALIILVSIYRQGDDQTKQRVFDAYMANTRFVNNWDLVDVSAVHIVGAFLADKSRKPLHRLAKSESLWERRISIVATFAFIKRGEFSETLRIAKMLLTDKEDLIHKAVGWMLREVAKRDFREAEKFLRKHYKAMPRTMLRYAIEKHPESLRQMYLKGTVSSSAMIMQRHWKE